MRRDDEYHHRQTLDALAHKSARELEHDRRMQRWYAHERIREAELIQEAEKEAAAKRCAERDGEGIH